MTLHTKFCPTCQRPMAKDSGDCYCQGSHGCFRKTYGDAMTDEEKIAWTEQASYEDLLRKWRFAPLGDPFFKPGPAFSHYKARMERMREEAPAEHVRASKAIGWMR